MILSEWGEYRRKNMFGKRKKRMYNYTGKKG
jgi:hypothetical protein